MTQNDRECEIFRSMPQSLSNTPAIFDGKKPSLFTINLKQIAFDKCAKLDFSPDGEEGKSEPTMPLPMPLLPRINDHFKFPPKCPLNTVTFIQLRKF